MRTTPTYMFPQIQDPVDYFNLLSFDPGSKMFGIALFKVDIKTLTINSCNAWTINIEKFHINNILIETYGYRYAKLLVLKEYLLGLFNLYHPFIIATESPFINSKFPLSGIVLFEVLNRIKDAIAEYDNLKMLYMIPPSNVKNAVGVIGDAKKDPMNIALQRLPDLNYKGLIRLSDLDEHSIDALAVGYGKITEMREGNLC